MVREVLLENMTWPELQERVKESDIAVLCIGAVEEHGPHLPLGTDTFQLFEAVKTAALKVADEVGAVVLPPVWFGPSTETRDFPGTFDIDVGVASNYVYEIMKNAIRNGFRKIVVVSGHDPNALAISTAIRRLISEGAEAFMVFTDVFHMNIDTWVKEGESDSFGHGCEIETSMIMYLRPELVRKDKLALGDRVPKQLMPYEHMRSSKFPYSTPVEYVWNYHVLKSGIHGDPTKASREKGERVLTSWIDKFADFLKELKQIDPGKWARYQREASQGT